MSIKLSIISFNSLITSVLMWLSAIKSRQRIIKWYYWFNFLKCIQVDLPFMCLLDHYWKLIFRHSRHTNIYDIEKIESLFWFRVKSCISIVLSFSWAFKSHRRSRDLRLRCKGWLTELININTWKVMRSSVEMKGMVDWVD